MNSNTRTHKATAFLLALAFTAVSYATFKGIFEFGRYFGDKWSGAFILIWALGIVGAFLDASLMAGLQRLSLRLFSTVKKDAVPAYSTRLSSQFSALISILIVNYAFLFSFEYFFLNSADPSLPLTTRLTYSSTLALLLLPLITYHFATSYTLSALSDFSMLSAQKANIIPTGILALILSPLIFYYSYTWYNFESALRGAPGVMTSTASSAQEKSSTDGASPSTNTENLEETCAPKNEGSRVFRNASLSSDTFFERNQTGTSWSVRVERLIDSGSTTFKEGKLISPRGGVQDGVFYILPVEWNCAK
jgi:hypothetical protein